MLQTHTHIDTQKETDLNWANGCWAHDSADRLFLLPKTDMATMERERKRKRERETGKPPNSEQVRRQIQGRALYVCVSYKLFGQ